MASQALVGIEIVEIVASAVATDQSRERFAGQTAVWFRVAAADAGAKTCDLGTVAVSVEFVTRIAGTGSKTVDSC